jgi:hypothetical protein
VQPTVGKQKVEDGETMEETTADNNNDNDNDNLSEEEDIKEEEESAAADSVFARDIVWTPHSFGPAAADSTGISREETTRRTQLQSSCNSNSYQATCPQGGPGGLICCETCTASYSSYLTLTAKDMEVQKTYKAGKEVQEMLRFLEQGKEKLDLAVKTARKVPPPLPTKYYYNAAAAAATTTETTVARKPSRKSASANKKEASSSEWNLTSSIDIGATKGIAV